MSQTVELPRAAHDIARTYWKRTMGGRSVSPFFLLTGAGVSNPPLPLASKVVELCRKEMSERGIPLPPRTGSPAQQYFEHLDRAFSSPEERREFLSGLFEGHKPSPANRLAARLVHPEEGLTDLLVTTNLDDMGAKSLRALGVRPVVLDHPAEIVQRFRPVGSPAVQVLHLHGTCDHSDFCNLEKEIRQRARKLHPALKALLYSRSPLVAGYSGWEKDAFMKALRARIREAEGAMLEELYWFCYTQDDAAALPGWLKQDPRVRIVAPSSNGADQGRLPAERVFETLLQARAAEKPAARTVRRPRRPTPAAPSAVIAAAEAAVGRGAFAEALDQLRPLSPQTLTEGARASYDTVLEKVYLGTRETAPALGQEACLLRRMAITVGLSASKTSLATAIDARMRLGRAVYGEGVCHVALGQHQEALLRFDETLALTQTGKDGLRGRAAHALNGKAVALFGFGRTDEALQVWEELLQIEPGADAEVAEALALGRFNLGLASFKLGRAEAAAVQWTDLVEQDLKLVATPQARALAERAAASLRLLAGGKAAAPDRELQLADPINNIGHVRGYVVGADGSLREIDGTNAGKLVDLAEGASAALPAEPAFAELDERQLHLWATADLDTLLSLADAALSDVAADTGTAALATEPATGGAPVDRPRQLLFRFDGVVDITPAALADIEQVRFAPSGTTRMDADLSDHRSASTPAEPTAHGREPAIETWSTTTAAAPATGARVLAWPAADLRQLRRRRPDQRRRAGFAPEHVAAAA